MDWRGADVFGWPHASATFWSLAFTLAVMAAQAGVSTCTMIIIYTICQVLRAPNRINDQLLLFIYLLKPVFMGTPARRDTGGLRAWGGAPAPALIISLLKPRSVRISNQLHASSHDNTWMKFSPSLGCLLCALCLPYALLCVFIVLCLWQIFYTDSCLILWGR